MPRKRAPFALTGEECLFRFSGDLEWEIGDKTETLAATISTDYYYKISEYLFQVPPTFTV
jgi:hypothetical protein